MEDPSTQTPKIAPQSPSCVRSDSEILDAGPGVAPTDIAVPDEPHGHRSLTTGQSQHGIKDNSERLESSEMSEANPKSISPDTQSLDTQSRPSQTAPQSPHRNDDAPENQVTSPTSTTMEDEEGKADESRSAKDLSAREAQDCTAKCHSQESPREGQSFNKDKKYQRPNIEPNTMADIDKPVAKDVSPSLLTRKDPVGSRAPEHSPAKTKVSPELHDDSEESVEDSEDPQNYQEMQEKIIALEEKLAEKTADVDRYLRLWKKTALQADEVRPRPGFEAVTDRELADMAKALRYNIRNFTIQYFEGEFSRQNQLRRTLSLGDYMSNAAPGINAYKAYLKSPGKRPSIIQSFLWRVLDGEVFGKFLWAGTTTPESMSDLEQRLRPHPDDAEAERKFMTWRATTAALLLDSMPENQHDELTKGTGKILDDIYEVLAPYRTRHGSTREEGFRNQIFEILQKALEFDKEISKQTTQVDWIFDSSGEFDSSLMQRQVGERVSDVNPQVLLAISPAMMKRSPFSIGKASENNILLRMEVSCEPA